MCGVNDSNSAAQVSIRLYGRQSFLEAALPHDLFADSVDRGDIRIAEPAALQRAQRIERHLAELAERRDLAQLDDVGELLEKPGIDLGQVVQRFQRPSAAQRAEERPHAPIVRHDQPLAQRGLVFLVVPCVIRTGWEQACAAARDSSEANGLQERFLERAADRHRLADRLHLRRQRAIRLRELLEVPRGA